MVSSADNPKEVIIDGETGYVLPENSVGNWEKKILEVIDRMDSDVDYRQKIKNRSRQNVLEKSSWDGFFREFIN